MRFFSSRFYLIALMFLATFLASHRSSADDYRSIASGNWSSLSTWQESNNGGVTWVAATKYPGQITVGTVNIQSPHTVSVDVDPSGFGFGITSLIVPAGATLKDLPGSPPYYFSISGLTVSGTINLTNSVVVSPLRYLGVNNLTVNPGGSVSALRIMLYGGSISNNGTVTATGPGGFQSQVQGNATITGSGIFNINSLWIRNSSTVTSNFSGTYNETFNTYIDTGCSFITGTDATVVYNLSSITVATNTSVFSTSAIRKTKQLVISGDVSNTGTFTAGSATTKTINLSGANTIQFNDTLKVNSGFVTTNSSTIVVNTHMTGAGTFKQATNSTLNYGGASNSITTLNATATGNTVNYNSPTTNQAIAPFSYYNLTLSGAGGMTKSLSANTAVLGTVSIQNNSVFNLSGFDLTVGADWNNSSSANLAGTTNSTVTFNGSVQQNIINTGAAFGTFFYNLSFNNSFATSPQIVFSAYVYVWSAITMLKGNIDLRGYFIQLGANYSLTNTINHSGLSSAGWFYNGFFVRIFQDGSTLADGSTNGLFPLGTSTNFRPFYLSSPIVPFAAANVQIKVNTATNTTIVNIPDTGGPIVRQHQGYWLVNSFASSGNFNINAGGTGFGAVANVNDLRLSLASSVVGSAGANSGTTSFPMVQRTGITTANLTNNFYVSSVEPIGSYLPVQLVSFNGKVNGNAVDIDWETQSELNCESFTVLRSTDGKDFSQVGSLDGHGNTHQANHYFLQDTKATTGNNYYRLVQTDFDKGSEILKTIVVEVKNGSSLLGVYPNPVSSGNFVNISLSGLLPQIEQEVQVVDLQGRVHSRKKILADEIGNFRGQFKIDFDPGIYILKINSTNVKLFVN